MKLAKGFFLAIIGLFIVITLFSLLIPSSVMTVRTTDIYAEKENVFAEIDDLQKWKRWHPVFMLDSSAIHFSTPSSGLNAYAEWKSHEKNNKLLINDVQPGRLHATLIRDGENNIENIILVTALKDNNIQVEWRVLTKLKWYPWEKFSGIFIDKMTGPGYEFALNNLKNLLEKNNY